MKKDWKRVFNEAEVRKWRRDKLIGKVAREVRLAIESARHIDLFMLFKEAILILQKKTEQIKINSS